MKTQIFKFVRHGQTENYVAAGWVIHKSLENSHHGQWAALAEWPHDGEPVYPEADPFNALSA